MQPCPVLRRPVTQQWKRNGTTHFTFSQRVYRGGPKVLRDFLAAREFTSYTQCRLKLAVYRKSLINIFRNRGALARLAVIRLLFTNGRWLKARKHQNCKQSRFSSVFSSSHRIRFSRSLLQRNGKAVVNAGGLPMYHRLSRISILIAFFFGPTIAACIPVMHRPTTGPADKIDTRISEVVSLAIARARRNARNAEALIYRPLRRLRAERRVVREYLSAIPCADPRAASLRKREIGEERRSRGVLHSSRAILARRIRTDDTPPRAAPRPWHPRRGATYSRATGARI